jgi:hypothetical protein
MKVKAPQGFLSLLRKAKSNAASAKSKRRAKILNKISGRRIALAHSLTTSINPGMLNLFRFS